MRDADMCPSRRNQTSPVRPVRLQLTRFDTPSVPRRSHAELLMTAMTCNAVVAGWLSR